ncbi:MAG: ABC transporter permease subunit [Betaproteobacteria bacterium]|nr:ABC transporter permease subunit [Betaproteobacteria bacterium]
MNNRPQPRTVRWLMLAALLCAWQLLPATGLVPELFLPALSKTLAVLFSDWKIYGVALLVTLGEVVLAMVIALYPVLTAWLGVGPQSKVVFAGVYAFFPVMLSTAAGIRTIDPQYLLVARSMGASLTQQVMRVIIPAALPTVFTGLRLGGALAIIGVVVAEMLTAAAGIGYLVTLNRTILDSPRVFAALLMILVLSVAYDMLARRLEARLLKWVPQRQSPMGPRTGLNTATTATAA